MSKPLRPAIRLPGAHHTDPARVAADDSGGEMSVTIRTSPTLRRRARDFFGSLRNVDPRPLLTEGPAAYTERAAQRQLAAARRYGAERAALEESRRRVMNAMRQAQVAAKACADLLLRGEEPPPELESDPWVAEAMMLRRESRLARNGTDASDSQTASDVARAVREVGHRFETLNADLVELRRVETERWAPIMRLAEVSDARMRALTRFGVIRHLGLYSDQERVGTPEAKRRYREWVERDVALAFKASTRAKRRLP